MLTGVVLDRRNFLFDAWLTLATNNNELVSFNGALVEDRFGSFASVQRHREGYPMGAFWAVDVERDASGEPVLNSSNNAIVKSSCRWAPDDPTWDRASECDEIYMGPSRPTREVGLGGTFTLFNDFRISTQFDYRGGHYQWCAICSINSRSDLNTWDINTGGPSLNPNVSAPTYGRSGPCRRWPSSARRTTSSSVNCRCRTACPRLWPNTFRAAPSTTSPFPVVTCGCGPSTRARATPRCSSTRAARFTMLDYASTPMTRRLSASLRVGF